MRILVLAAAVLLVAGCVTPPPNVSSSSAAATTSTASYAPLLESPIRGLSLEEIASIESGAGMRFALPAELNGFAGPKHVLELADGLGLNGSQRAQMQALYNVTNAQARVAGADLLAKWRALDQGFRNASLDGQSLRAAVHALDEAQSEVRYVHLRAHLEADGMLTPQQRSWYWQLRGYGAALGDAHGDGHGDAHDMAGGGHAHP